MSTAERLEVVNGHDVQGPEVPVHVLPEIPDEGHENGASPRPEEAEPQGSLPPELRPGEYGCQRERVELYLGQLIMLEQTREGISQETGKIQDSIKQNGLFYDPHVARMGYKGMAEYVDFVNDVWGARHRIEDLPHDEEGYYYLVEDGHSRAVAITREEMEKARTAYEKWGIETDPSSAKVMCVVRDNPTPWEVISKQAESNIHRTVPKEREAMGIVESFYYGQKLGMWKTKEEFINGYGKNYSRDTVNEALRFLELPSFAREEVFGGRLKYSIAIELAKTYRLYIPYKLASWKTTWDELSEKGKEDLLKASMEWVDWQIARVQGRVDGKKQLNSGAARMRYLNTREEWTAVIEGNKAPLPSVKRTNRTDDDGGQLAFAATVRETPDEQARLNRKEQLKEYRALLTEIRKSNDKKLIEAMELHVKFASEDEGVQDLLDQEMERIRNLEWELNNNGQRALIG